MTEERALELHEILAKAAVSLPDADAVKVKGLYAVWQPDKHYEPKGFRLRDPVDGLLYKLIPDTHDSQADWPPRLVPAVWEHIPEEGQGTKDNPIPYNNSMRLELGKYYIQDGVVYICILDSINPVYSPLSALVGLYVERVD